MKAAKAPSNFGIFLPEFIASPCRTILDYFGIDTPTLWDSRIRVSLRISRTTWIDLAPAIKPLERRAGRSLGRSPSRTLWSRALKVSGEVYFGDHLRRPVNIQSSLTPSKTLD